MKILEIVSFEDGLQQLEAAIAELARVGATDQSFHAARRHYCSLLCSTAHLSIRSGSIGEILDAAANSTHRIREVALLTLRVASIDGFFPDKSVDRHIEIRVMNILQRGAPDLLKELSISDRMQTFERFRRARQLHGLVLSKFDAVRTVQGTTASFSSSKSSILKALNTPFCRDYLSIFGIGRYSDLVSEVTRGLSALEHTDIDQLSTEIDRIDCFIDKLRNVVHGENGFLANAYLRPFVAASVSALAGFKAKSQQQLKAVIRPLKREGPLAEKRYPLHREADAIAIRVPFINEGPATASDVQIGITGNEDEALFDSCIRIGTARPGEFIVDFYIIPQRELPYLDLVLDVQWTVLGSGDRDRAVYQTRIEAQNRKVDWASLSRAEKYSTEVAEAGEFVGREAKVRALSARMQKAKMQSSYITGQKRVGKTSLAKAVQRLVVRDDGPNQYHFCYLEWGDYSHASPEKTLKQLGDAIANDLREYFPGELLDQQFDFLGTIAPLNKIVAAIGKAHPTLRIVIILDEFDEIHQELYRRGNLAEALFSGLRTLSSKSNIAFIFVGGENMPFIIQAQGDQLNKFIREPLDYFTKIAEWDDYRQLITRPTDGSIVWESDAIDELYAQTCGHPYYTKLLCSRIFANAVQQKDAEICRHDVLNALSQEIASLDVNAFSHLWTDGIEPSIGDAEIHALKRARVLASIGRVLREGLECSAENISRFNIPSRLPNEDISVVLEDFVRREVISFDGQRYVVKLPLFSTWLAEIGVNRIVADKLGEELETEEKHREDAAYVNSSEIATVVSGWGPYRGVMKTGEDLRAWLSQFGSNSNQRLMFTLLQNLRYISETEIREKCLEIHDMIKVDFQGYVVKKATDRRRDLAVVYVDGNGKSGHMIATKYAEQNKISTQCIFSASSFQSRSNSVEQRLHTSFNGVVILDDIAATGKSLEGNVMTFLQENSSFIQDRNMHVVVAVLVSTKEAEERIRRSLGEMEGISADFRFCELLSDRHFAFPKETLGFWRQRAEYDAGKALCLEAGSRLVRRQPLGFNNQGLLLVFSFNCPNNTLPIVHAGGKGDFEWIPLFERLTN